MYVYLILKENSNHYKIGVSNNPNTRLNQLQTANSTPLLLVDKFKTNFSFKLEKYVHRNYAEKQTIGEWFVLDEEDVKNFKVLCEKQEKNLELIKSNNSYVASLKKW